MSLSKSLKKDNVRNIANKESDFNYDSKYKFYRFYKQCDEFEEMSLDSKHNKMKEFRKLLNNFKNLKPLKQGTQNELYEKYYNFYKNDFDDELSEAKKKKRDCKQFELFDKIDKKLTLDGETKSFIKQIENKKKIVDKKGFTKCFSYEPTALVNKLLGQNTQDLRKSLNEIKQQKIKLNEDERNSTNNKNKNDEVNNMLSVVNRINQFFEYNFFWVNNQMNQIYQNG